MAQASIFVKQLHTLDTFRFPYSELYPVWGSDKRYGVDTIQRFLLLNAPAFDFLNIKAVLEMLGNDACLVLITSQYAGCIPMLSPVDGKVCGDISVGGRFGEDIAELLPLLGETLMPEYNDTLPELTSTIIEPPLYFECCNFIDQWSHVERANWNKFDVVDRIEDRINSGTNWSKYALQSYDCLNTFRYPNRSNTLKKTHKEFLQLLSVLNACIAELTKHTTPIRTRMAYADRVAKLKAKYADVQCVDCPEEFVVHASDPIVVKNIKPIANRIIQGKRTNKRPWRVDFSVFFERYVQYLFCNVCRSKGASNYSNIHYNVGVDGIRPKWSLHYLEPDLILQKDQTQYVVDAKYKSHIFNWNDYSDDLYDTFRHDFHQILAYCSFNQMTTKNALLVYPFSDFSLHKLKAKSPLTNSEANVFLVGVPMERGKLEEVKEKLSEIVNF